VWRIGHLTIEGFRGLNKRVEMSFDRKSPITLLKGPNGFGKTSTLQAIEWCLTGSLMFFSGGDFTREDALVNLFHPDKKGFVEMALEDDRNSIKIRRSKKMGRSTGRGGSSLDVTIDGENLTDDDAESSLQKTIFESVDEPAALFHLHQDSIRQILMADPKERSRAIERS
jgi:exonuclease SbcC